MDVREGMENSDYSDFCKGYIVGYMANLSDAQERVLQMSSFMFIASIKCCANCQYWDMGRGDMYGYSPCKLRTSCTRWDKVCDSYNGAMTKDSGIKIFNLDFLEEQGLIGPKTKI